MDDQKTLRRAGSYKALTYLLLFGLATTVPLVLLFGALLIHSASAQRAQLESRELQALDALVNDIDREFDRDLTILHTLATSEALASEDWPTFYKQAKAGLQGRAYLVLTDSQGRQLVNTYVPYGEQPAITGDPETIRLISETKAPVVSNLFTSLVVKRPVFNISIPILRNNQVRYVMSLGLLPDDLYALLNEQKLGSEWGTLIWDANGVLLARSQEGSRFVGKRVPQNMREHDQRGVVRTVNLDGVDVLHATARSQLSGWGVGVNLPYSLVTEQMRNSLVLWGVAGLLAITIALVAGVFFARQLTMPLSIAADAAAAFGRGEAFPLTGSRLKEADAFLVTLRDAHQAREKLTDEVERNRDWLQTTLVSIGDAVIATDAEGRITLMNPVAEKLTGWTLAEASGKALSEVFRIVNQETRLTVENPVDKVRRLNRVVGLANHTILISRSGEEIAIDDSGAPIIELNGKIAGVVLVFRDVAEARIAEMRLAEQAGMLELAWDAIIARDESGRILYWNRGAEELYGWSRQEAVGQIAHDLLETKFPQPLAEIVEQIHRQSRWQGELVHRCKSGEYVTVLSRWALAPRKDPTDPGSIMEINTDISRRKQLEAALQSNERLALAGRLSASIAHEIHNPLDTIANVLFLISQRTGGQPEIRQLLTMAQSEAQRVSEISKNMLSLHRESRAAFVKLSDLLEGVIALIEETIAKGRRNIDLVPGFEGKIEAFPSELRQVFTNVIKNAVEATDDGGEIKIYCEATQEAGQNGVLVRVVDNGVGVPKDVRSRLFTPFVTSKEETGTGLGLWVSRNILEKHGGSIRLESNAGPDTQGTTVSIFLPLRMTSGKAVRPVSGVHAEAAG